MFDLRFCLSRERQKQRRLAISFQIFQLFGYSGFQARDSVSSFVGACLRRRLTLGFADVLRLQAQADEASGEVLGAGKLCEDTKRQGWGDGAGVLQGA